MENYNFSKIYNKAVKVSFKYVAISFLLFFLGRFDPGLGLFMAMYGFTIGSVLGMLAALIVTIKNKAKIRHIILIMLLNPFLYLMFLFIYFTIDIQINGFFRGFSDGMNIYEIVYFFA